MTLKPLSMGRTLPEWSLMAAARGIPTIIEVTPVIQAATYAAGDLLNEKIEFSDPFGIDTTQPLVNCGLIQSVWLIDLNKADVNLDVLFFDVDPSNTSFTLNSAFAVHDTDILNILPPIHVTDWTVFNDNSVGRSINLDIPFSVASGASLYAALVTRGAPTYASTSDLTLRVGLFKG